MIGPKRPKRVPPSDDVWFAEWQEREDRRKQQALRRMTTQELEDELARRKAT